MSVIQRLQKRRFYPVTIDGETVHIRAMLQSEQREVLAVKDDTESVGFVIGVGLVNEDRTPVFVRSSGESVVDFGKRVLDELDWPTDTRSELVDKILRLSNGPPVASIEKKS